MKRLKLVEVAEAVSQPVAVKLGQFDAWFSANVDCGRARGRAKGTAY